MNLESITFSVEPNGRTRTATATCAHCKCAFSAHQKLHTDTWLPPLAETLASCAWRNDLTGSLVCSPSCADARIRQAGSLSYQVDGHEAERRQAAAGAVGALERIARDASRRTAVRVRCSRCAAMQELDAVDGPAAIATMTALGWHRMGATWACSRTCLEWMKVPVTPPAAPVLSIDDASYQSRRAVINRHGFPPGQPPVPKQEVSVSRRGGR